MEAIIETAVLTKLRRLPPTQQQEVLDFVEFLETKLQSGVTIATDNDLGQFTGQWQDARDADEIVAEMYAARQQNQRLDMPEW